MMRKKPAETCTVHGEKHLWVVELGDSATRQARVSPQLLVGDPHVDPVPNVALAVKLVPLGIETGWAKFVLSPYLSVTFLMDIINRT